MSNELSMELRRYLTDCGTPERQIARCDHETRMYHDLGIWGEAAEDYLTELAEGYQVDLSGFLFESYFPPEFEGSNPFTAVLYLMFPFIRKRREYLPLTLGMIESAMRTQSWQAVNPDSKDAGNLQGA